MRLQNNHRNEIWEPPNLRHLETIISLSSPSKFSQCCDCTVSSARPGLVSEWLMITSSKNFFQSLLEIRGGIKKCSSASWFLLSAVLDSWNTTGSCRCSKIIGEDLLHLPTDPPAHPFQADLPFLFCCLSEQNTPPQRVCWVIRTQIIHYPPCVGWLLWLEWDLQVVRHTVLQSQPPWIAY